MLWQWIVSCHVDYLSKLGSWFGIAGCYFAMVLKGK
jgi:hypothetical protein